MAIDIFGGKDYALLQRNFLNYDYVQLSFAGPLANVQQSYVVGTMAYLANNSLINGYGWTLFTPTAPLPLIYQAIGATQGPGFAAKEILFYATQDCAISFDTPTNVAVAIPANTFMRFHLMHLVFYATQNGGTLDAWIEG